MAVQQQLVTPKMVYIHLETTNKSFLDMRYFLKSKGIQNCDFFLSLLDRDLIGINPRDPNLPSIMKAKVMNECRRNYWYFLREIVKIPEQGGDPNSGARYRLHRGNLAMNFLFVLNINQYVELPRQFGKTVAAVCRYLWCYNFGTSNSRIMFMHKAHQGSKDNLKSLKNIRDALPSYLQMSSALNNEGKQLKVPNTVINIVHPYNHNEIITFASARTPDSANNLGRGATMPMQFYDEFAFMPYNKIIYEAAVPAFSTAAKNAARNGAPYGILITTTPGDLLSDSGKYAYQIRNNAIPWNEAYYDKTYQEIQEIINSNNSSTFFMVSYKYQQLGAGPEYFRKMVLDLQKDYTAIRREIMLEWAETATDCPFSEEDLEKIKMYCKEPIRTVLFGKHGQYQFQVYDDVDLSNPPIVGVDVAGALWQDSSAITVIDSKTTKVCATLNCNFIPSDDLAEVIYELVSKYMPSAIVNIERNGGFGVSVIQRLCKTSVKKNLYWTIKDKVIEESFNGVRAVKKNARVKVYGTDSTKEVRARLIEILYERVALHKDKFIAPILHAEMSGMQIKKNGKVEHSDNSHDDQVFSYLHALYVWYDGENLADRFHILKNTIKTDEEEEIVESEIEDQLEKKEKIDMTELEYDPEEKADIIDAINFVNNDKFVTTKTFKESNYMMTVTARNNLLNTNKAAREAYAKETGLDPSSFLENGGINNYVQLPETLFLDTDALSFDDDDNSNSTPDTVIGNLADMWNKL